MRNIISLLSLIILSWSLGSCTKHSIVVEEGSVCCPGDCLDDIDIFTLSFGYNPKYEGIHHVMPYFNPLNNREFVFYEYDYSASTSRMLIHDLETGASSEVVNSVVLGFGLLSQPKWTRTGWIVFQGSNSNIYKIKRDGSSLVQLTFSGASRWPEVNYDGSLITYSEISLLGSPLIDINGVLLDTLFVGAEGTNSGWKQSSWNSENQIASATGAYPDYGIGYWNYSDGVQTSLLPHPAGGQNRIEVIQWHPNNRFIYFTKWSNSLWRVDVSSGVEREVKKGCYRRYYPAFSISQCGTQMIACKLEVDSITPADELLISQKLVLMDINGCGQVVINP